MLQAPVLVVLGEERCSEILFWLMGKRLGSLNVQSSRIEEFS